MRQLYLFVLVILIFLIVCRCSKNGYTYADGYSSTRSVYSDRLSLAEPGQDCGSCMKECSKLPGFASNSVAIKDCSLKCFQPCAVNENLDCPSTCTQLGDTTLCNKACGTTQDLGCRWNCKMQGSGDYCRRTCPPYS